MNNQHANTEAARRLAAAQIGGEDQVFDFDVQVGDHVTLRNMPESLQDVPAEYEVTDTTGGEISATPGHTTAQDARQRIRDAAIGDVVPLDTFPARAKSPVNTVVSTRPQRREHLNTTTLKVPSFAIRTFERVDGGWKRVT